MTRAAARFAILPEPAGRGSDRAFAAGDLGSCASSSAEVATPEMIAKEPPGEDKQARTRQASA